MHLKRKKKIIKGMAAVITSILLVNLSGPANFVFANAAYDYSNAIYNEGMEDVYIYDSNDKVVTTKTGVQRTIPKTSGIYDRSYYPIPLVNEVPSQDIFELIKAENKELMDKVETDIQNGTLTKHIAADGQFYGNISDDVLGVEKKIYVNTNSKGTHSLASYVPAGEIATVTLSEEALFYAKKGWIKISVGMTMVDATNYTYNQGTNNRMPYLGKTFSVSERETQVGTPFGGMVFIEINSSVPSGLQLEVDIKGVVDSPYYDLGQTTSKEWKTAKDAAGLFAEIRTPYLRFIVPSYFIREVEDPNLACLFWTNATTLSATLMAQEARTTPMTLIFDDYITAGLAYASVGNWTCNLPSDWATSALDYERLMESGNWGLIHEINHHYQRRYNSYNDEWGLGNDFTEVTNNVLSTISYILYTNIAAYRGENGTDDWNKVVDPYSSLKQQMYEGEAYYKGVPNVGNFAFSTLAHELGPLTLANIIKSTYDGATFQGIEIPAYDYKSESEGKKTREERYDDYAYRICVASERDYTWYLREELGWPLTQEMVDKIEAIGYEKVIPVQSVYGMGEVGRETGRPYYVPSTGYIFDFENSLVSPGTTTLVDVSTPKYGTLTKLDNGTYSYTPSTKMPDGKNDEFTLTVLVEAGGISRKTQLNCTIGLLYNSVSVDHYAITKWDIYEALETLKVSTPYKTTASNEMKISAADDNSLAKTIGYFKVLESGEYTIQAFGDDRAVFELHQEDGTTLQSLTVDYASTAEDAYKQSGSTHFTVKLEANTPYAYTLIAKNNDGVGWGDVNIRSTAKDSSWKSIDYVYSNINDFGKTTDRSFTVSNPAYVRPSKLAASTSTTLKDISVISAPQGVTPNNDPNSSNEGDPNNIVDGDVSTYFHSSYTDSDKTPLPHDYIFDLGSEQSFNQIDILYRRTGDECGVIGDYEIYVANTYDGNNTNWTLVAQDNTRKDNSSAKNDIKVSLADTTARYVKVRALNNRGSYDLSIIAEVTFTMNSIVNNVIAQNSSYIQYVGEWTKDTNGVFVNGATYNTTKGRFQYCFNGLETNIYVTKDTKAEIRIDGGEWKTVNLIGSLREPSITLTMPTNGEHSVEVRGIGEEIALNMLSTDGIFTKGTDTPISNSLSIHGATNIEIPVSKVASFDALAGVSYKDELGLTGLEIKVTGELGIPIPGSNKEYKLVYSVADAYHNTTSVERVVTVTNQVPEIHGLTDLTITEGEGKDFDYSHGVTAIDYEDTTVTTIELPTLDLSTLSAGEYTVDYVAKDSDGNRTVAQRKIYVKAKEVTSDQDKENDTNNDTNNDIDTDTSETTPEVTLNAVKNLTATASGVSQIRLTWSKVDEASGYRVYRYNTSTKEYVLINTIENNTIVSYQDSKLSSGTTYKYKVVAYKDALTSSESLISATTKLAAPKVSIKATATNSVTIKWSKVTGATGYKIYRYNASKKKFVLIKTIVKNTTVSFKDSKLSSGTTYKYKVVAYKKAMTSSASQKSATTKPGTVKIRKITTTSKKATISWAKIKRASGYEVYRSTSKNGKYKKVATIKKVSTLKFTNSKLTANSTYYYKVRAYKVVKGKKIYGAYSNIKSIKVLK